MPAYVLNPSSRSKAIGIILLLLAILSIFEVFLCSILGILRLVLLVLLVCMVSAELLAWSAAKSPETVKDAAEAEEDIWE